MNVDMDLHEEGEGEPNRVVGEGEAVDEIGIGEGTGIGEIDKGILVGRREVGEGAVLGGVNALGHEKFPKCRCGCDVFENRLALDFIGVG